jgi:hypothetical protein
MQYGSGLSPDPPPFQNITTFKHKYKRANPYNKEHVRECWLAECYKGFVVGGGPGVEPRGLHIILHIYNHINQSHSDTWRQWVGPRVHTLLATNDMCQHPIGQPPSNKNMPHHQTAMHHDGTALPHGRTDYTDRYSQHPRSMMPLDII